MRIIVTGSRLFTARDLIWGVLREVHREALAAAFEARVMPDRILTVVHGACPPRPDGTPGADELAHRWCLRMRYAVAEERYPADWERHGRRAGPLRNEHMVRAGADRCYAFFRTGEKNTGTGGCVRLTVAARIPVRAFDEHGLLGAIPVPGRRHTRAVAT